MSYSEIKNAMRDLLEIAKENDNRKIYCVSEENGKLVAVYRYVNFNLTHLYGSNGIRDFHIVIDFSGMPKYFYPNGNMIILDNDDDENAAILASAYLAYRSIDA